MRTSFAPLPTPAVRRVRRVTRRDGERAADAPIEDPVKKFRVETFFGTVDSIISLISERFDDRAQGVFKDLGLFTHKRMMQIKEDPASMPDDAFKAFCAIYKKFVKEEDLRREYLQLTKIYENYQAAMNLPMNLHDDAEWIDLTAVELVGDVGADDNEVQVGDSLHGSETVTGDHDHDNCIDDDDDDPDPLPLDADISSEVLREEEALSFKNIGSMKQIFQVMHCSGLKTVFPSLHIALRIAVTLPVSSASTERSFSKLKLIKKPFKDCHDARTPRTLNDNFL